MTAPQLKNILEAPYNRADWQQVLREHFGVQKLAANPEATHDVSGLKKDLATSACELGVLETAEKNGSRLIGIYEVQVAPRVQLHRNRVGLRELLGRVIRDTVDGALIVFVQGEKWRFSYVSEVYIRDENGARKQKKTDPRRYTYLLGRGERARTATDRFLRLNTPAPGQLALQTGITLDALEAAFNVEKLSKSFFDTYRSHYDKFVLYLTGEDRKGTKVGTPAPALRSAFNGSEKAARDFVKKLLGRIVFLYFLEKKGWLGVPEGQPYGKGDEDFLHRLFREFKAQDAFYVAALAPLFFETLNQKRAGDFFKTDPALFENPSWSRLKIPYLNGGLFEPDTDDKRLEIVFPKEYFGALFQFFDQYNFTVYEDSPEEHTVAVDPEMLGHIFENLLEDNKDKGAFYTPKEIVHYMCQESLIAYLTTRIKADAEAQKGIELFLREGVERGIMPHTEDLLLALREVKICDPAIGSGAFPMGLLMEILHAVEVLWSAAPDTAACIWNISATEWQPALVKAAIIQHSIYGVDIEQGAVDIARLRFWLSLVVDEDEPQPLPNLDYKIMVGNSLLSKYDGQVIDIDWEVKIDGAFTEEREKMKLLQKGVEEKLALLFRKQGDYFDYDGNKQLLQEEIRNLKIDVLLAQLQLSKYKADQDKATQGSIFGATVSRAAQKKAAEAVAQVNGFAATMSKLKTLKGTRAPLHYFDWKLDFPEVMNEKVAETVGFDIVIGNPPYIQLQNDGGKLAKMYEGAKYETFERTGDIYSLFYEKGWQILKKSGHLIFITSNKWMRAGYGESTRKFFAEKTDPILLVDFAGQKIFESATVDTNILLFSKDKNRQQTKACTVKEKVPGKMSDYIEQHTTQSAFHNSDSWVILSEIEQRIKAKIEAVGTPLKDWDINIYRGVLTGYNEAFIVNGAKRAELIAEDPKSAEIIRPILRGRDIKRYGYEFADLWIIATFPSLKIDIEKYPAIKRHLLTFGLDRLKQTGEPGARKKTNNKWYETQDSIGYWEDFERQKIVYPDIMRMPKNEAAFNQYPYLLLDNECFCVEATNFMIVGKDLESVFLFLTSEVGFYVFSRFYSGPQFDATGFRYKKAYLELTYIPKPNEVQKAELKKILLDINNESAFSTEEVWYKIIGLTKAEVSFIKSYKQSLLDQVANSQDFIIGEI